MKKRKMLILSIIVVCLIAIAVLVVVIVRANRPDFSPEMAEMPEATGENVNSELSLEMPEKINGDNDLEGQKEMENFDINDFDNQETLIGLFDSERDAQKAADQYGIILQSYEYGVAEFQLQSWQDANEIIQLGIDNGWAQLSTSEKRELY